MSTPPLKNNTNYPAFISKLAADKLREYKEKKADPTVGALKYYQYIVREMMKSPYYGRPGYPRGLLIYEEPGLGKSITAGATALAIILELVMTGRRSASTVVVISSKTLHEDFKGNVRKIIHLMYPDQSDTVARTLAAAVDESFQYVSIDAYNMPAQFAKRVGTLDGKLLIIDEAHNFFRSIISSNDEFSNARQLFRIIMAAKGLRILFLTGTPLAKNIFEMVPCFNMLMGAPLLPIQYDIFSQYYVDRVKRELINADRLADRLYGLVSFAQIFAAKAREVGGFPEVFKTKIERIEMSEEQYKRYMVIREIEKRSLRDEDRRRPSGITKPMTLPAHEAAAGSFYVKSRACQNFSPKGEYSRIDKVPPEEITPENSPKMAKIVEIISKGPRPSLVHSQFIGLGGLGALELYLKKAGWKKYDPEKAQEGLIYAVITGKVSMSEREQIKTTLKAKNNPRGVKVAALLASRPGAEGLNLEGFRQVIAMEPYWYQSRFEQVKARIIRIHSHDHLPIEERDVQPYLFMARENKAIWDKIQGEKEPITVDEKIYRRAYDEEMLCRQGRTLFRQVSIECEASGYSDCRLCDSTDRTLYGEEFEPSPCKSVKKVKTETIKYEGIDYPYSRDGDVLRFYQKQEEDVYTEINQEDKLYVILSKLVPSK